MSAGSHRPPRVLAALVDLFAAPHEADGILGDLAEGFSADLADKSAARASLACRRHDEKGCEDLQAISDWYPKGKRQRCQHCNRPGLRTPVGDRQIHDRAPCTRRFFSERRSRQRFEKTAAAGRMIGG